MSDKPEFKSGDRVWVHQPGYIGDGEVTSYVGFFGGILLYRVRTPEGIIWTDHENLKPANPVED